MVTTTAILEFAASPIEAVKARQPLRNLTGNLHPVLLSINRLSFGIKCRPSFKSSM